MEARDPRYDLYRIRSNLCELPTTYITNNCQLDLSNGLTADVMDYLEKRPKSGVVEWRDGNGGDGGGTINNNSARTSQMSSNKIRSSPSGRYGRGLSCFEKSPLKNVVHITNLEPQYKDSGGDAGAVERRRTTTTYNQCCDTRLVNGNL